MGLQDDQIRTELLIAVREILRYALLTLNAVRDPDRRYRGFAKLPQTIVHDVSDAYGYSTPWIRRFSPTAHDISQMEVVLPWLAWLRRTEGQTAIRRLIAWSLGVSVWRIGQREQCSDATILNRINRSTAAIIREFCGVQLEVEHVEEPYKGVVYAMVWEYPTGSSGKTVIPMRIYVGGRGLWKAGKWLRTGEEKAEKYLDG
jgi:Domain of unknown function (DUF6362)